MSRTVDPAPSQFEDDIRIKEEYIPPPPRQTYEAPRFGGRDSRFSDGDSRDRGPGRGRGRFCTESRGQRSDGVGNGRNGPDANAKTEVLVVPPKDVGKVIGCVSSSFTMERKWLDDLENAWYEGKGQSTDTLVDLLHAGFNKSPNCFESAINLMMSTKDFFWNSPHSLCLTVMREFQEWVCHHPGLYNLLGKEMKHRALVTVITQTNISLIDVVCQVYKLADNPLDYTEVVENLLIRNDFTAASIVVAKLKLQSYYGAKVIAIPLYLLDKMELLDIYMEGERQIQMDLVKYLDQLCKEPSVIGQLTDMNSLKWVSEDRLCEKTIARAVSKLLKQYDLSVDLCPNVDLSRRRSALMYLIIKWYKEGGCSAASWREMICEVVGNNTKLQHYLLVKILSQNDYETALSFALNLCYPEKVWPKVLLDYKRQCGPKRLDQLRKSWTLPDVPECSDSFLRLKLELKNIVMVNSRAGFKKCISVILRYDILGIDAEWKPNVGLAPSRLALVQLAVWDVVFILDVPKLLVELRDSDWDELYSGVLSAHTILKLGYGISEDLRLLAETVKRPNAKVNKVVDLRSFSQKLRLECPQVIKPGLPKHNFKGLAELSYLVLGLPLNKDEQCSNWERRPLRKAQLVYAALDAHCLLDIYEELYKRGEGQCLDMAAFVNNVQESIGGNEECHNRSQKYKPQVCRQNRRRPAFSKR